MNVLHRLPCLAAASGLLLTSTVLAHGGGLRAHPLTLRERSSGPIPSLRTSAPRAPLPAPVAEAAPDEEPAQQIDAGALAREEVERLERERARLAEENARLERELAEQAALGERLAGEAADRKLLEKRMAELQEHFARLVREQVAARETIAQLEQEVSTAEEQGSAAEPEGSSPATPIDAVPALAYDDRDTDGNGYWDTASRIGVDVSLAGSVSSDDIEDWYVIVPPTNGVLAITYGNTGGGDMCDVELTRIGDSELLLSSNIYGATLRPGKSGTMDLHVRGGESYYLEFKHKGGDQADYSLALRFEPLAHRDDAEPNDVASGAVPVTEFPKALWGTVGFSIQGEGTVVDQRDLYRVVVPRTGQLIVELENRSPAVSFSDLYDLAITREGESAPFTQVGVYGRRLGSGRKATSEPIPVQAGEVLLLEVIADPTRPDSAACYRMSIHLK